jgi:Ni/Co efflux regulator RcnB
MKKILIGAMALSLLGGASAMAQPDTHNQVGERHDSQGVGDRHDNDRHDNDRHDNDRHDNDRARYDHHRSHVVCSWHHHHKVCRRVTWR